MSLQFLQEQDLLWLYGRDGAAGGYGSRLSSLPVPGLRAAVQRAQRGVLNRTCLPSDVIAFVVFRRLRYRLSLRDLCRATDLSEMMARRGIEVSYG